MSIRRERDPTTRSRPRDADRAKWPIVRAYTPIPDAFQVSGYGTAGIVREQPDGKLSSAFFFLNLSGSGIDLMFGADDQTPETVEAVLRERDDNLPPFQEGPPDLAARYVTGAHAWTEDEIDWPAEARKRYLRMLPKFAGRQQWRMTQMFMMHPPIASEELLEAIDELVLSHDEAPKHKEMAVATFMQFEVADIEFLLASIRARPVDFEPLDPSRPLLFSWIKPRKYQPDERAAHGLIEVRQSTVWAHAATLSHASQMVLLMQDLSGRTSRLVDAEWRGPEALCVAPPGMSVIP